MWTVSNQRNDVNKKKLLTRRAVMLFSTYQHRKETTMSKLIHSYKCCPTSANRRRLVTYLAKHPFALCGAAAEEIAFLTTHEFI
jgi:hypothetical protein